MPEIAYPPLDVVKPIAQGVWLVDSGPIVAFGIPLPIRMTVLRLASGGLVLHSPTFFSMSLKAELDRLGPVEHLVAPNTVHWSYVQNWQEHYPAARTWAAPGLRNRPAVQRKNLRIDADLSDIAPDAWAGDIDTVVVPGSAGFREVELFHRASRTLVLTDLVVNLEPKKLPRLLGLGARVLGAAAPHGKAPVYTRTIIKGGGEPARQAAQRLVDFAPERVIFAHGTWFEHDGTAQLRRALDWLLP